jgi:hypothetical protein
MKKSREELNAELIEDAKILFDEPLTRIETFLIDRKLGD